MRRWFPDPLWRRPLPRRDLALSVLVAANFAVAPLLDVLARYPVFFTARDAPTADLVVFALGVTLVLPLLLGGGVALVSAANRVAGFVVHVTVLTWLVGLVFLRLLPNPASSLSVSAGLAGAAAFVLAVATVVTFYESALARSFVRLGLVAPFAFLGAFLLASPIGSSVLAQDEEAPADVDIGDPAPVIVLLFDELPLATLLDADGTVDGRRFPGFARLADESTWFRNATTNHALTVRAVPALLTGTRTPPDAEPTAEQHPVNLFTLLDEHYWVWQWERLTDLCPEEVCDGSVRRRAAGHRWRVLWTDAAVVGLHTLLPEPLTRGLPPIDHAWTGFGGASGEDEPWGFDAFLDTLPDTRGEPTLHFFHVLRPHFPWQQLPDGRAYTDSRQTPGLVEPEPGRLVWSDEEWPVLHGWQRHLLQAGEVDALVGRLLDRLDELGLSDEALVVVASDHGVAFAPGRPMRQVTEETLAEVAFVPLFLKLPGQEDSAVIDRPVELVDVVPTILDVLDADTDHTFDGRSVLDADGRSPRRVESFGRVRTVDVGLAEVMGEVARRIRHLGDGDWERVWRIGPRDGLLGASVDDLADTVDTTMRVVVDDDGRFADVDLDDEVPSLVTGRLRADESLEAPVDLAVAVNGRVAATARTFSHDGKRAEVSVLVPPEAFRRGANTVDVLPLVRADARSRGGRPDASARD